MVPTNIENKAIAMILISTTEARSILSGALFGAALTAAGVYSPTVIISQMKLESFHMLKVFLSASATSAAIFLLAHRLSPILAPPRQPSSLSLFPYDGNLIGGLLLGTGMALTGACPGTVLPQVVTGYSSGRYALIGGILGGIIYSKIRPYIRNSPNSCPSSSSSPMQDAKPTLYQKLDPKADEIKAVYIYQNFCWGIILLTSWLSKSQEQSWLSPTWGGVGVGAAQGASLWLTGNTLGTSAAYEQVGDLFWWGVEKFGGGEGLSQGKTSVNENGSGHSHLNGNGNTLINGNGNGSTAHKPHSPLKPKSTPRPSLHSLPFTFGILFGCYILSHTISLPSHLPSPINLNNPTSPSFSSSLDIPTIPSIPITRALLGGTTMVLGARVAGGCTSGHGISGMSLLSVSSILSVGAMFGGGIAWGLVLG